MLYSIHLICRNYIAILPANLSAIPHKMSDKTNHKQKICVYLYSYVIKSKTLYFTTSQKLQFYNVHVLSSIYKIMSPNKTVVPLSAYHQLHNKPNAFSIFLTYCIILTDNIPNRLLASKIVQSM